MFGLLAGFAVGLLFGITGGIMGGLEGVPGNLAAVTGPEAVLGRDRQVMLLLMLWSALGAGLVAGLVGMVSVGLASGLVGGLVLGLMLGLVFGLVLGVTQTAWLGYVIARAWLALRHRLARHQFARTGAYRGVRSGVNLLCPHTQSHPLGGDAGNLIVRHAGSVRALQGGRQDGTIRAGCRGTAAGHRRGG